LGIFASVGCSVFFFGAIFFYRLATLKGGRKNPTKVFWKGGGGEWHKVAIFSKGKKEVEIIIFRP
jgi:hypothetical protein